jgi:integrase
MNARVSYHDGGWYVHASVRGRRKARNCGDGKAAKRNADALAKSFQSLVNLNRVEDAFALLGTPKPALAPGSMPALRDAFEEWVARLEKSGDVRPATAFSYRSTFRAWTGPRIGGVPTDLVTRAQVGAVVSEARTAGRSRAVVEHLRGPLKRMFADLVERGLVAQNPAADLAHFVGRLPHGKRLDFFTAAEVAQALRAAEGLPVRALAATAFGTGLRWGELAALQREDVDLAGGPLHVSRSWSERAGRATPPKNGKARHVPVPAELAAVLREHMQVREAEGWGQDALLFFGADGRRLSASTTRRMWESLLGRAGLRVRPIHCARHTFASLALKSGVRPELVQRWLGHGSLQITLSTYHNFIADAEGDARDAARVGRAILGGAV